jgi:hypothetical protein
MAWEPMTPEEAQEFLDAWPAGPHSTGAQTSAAFLHALMVSWGLPPEQIRGSLELFLGRSLE